MRSLLDPIRPHVEQLREPDLRTRQPADRRPQRWMIALGEHLQRRDEDDRIYPTAGAEAQQRSALACHPKRARALGRGHARIQAEAEPPNPVCGAATCRLLTEITGRMLGADIGPRPKYAGRVCGTEAVRSRRHGARTQVSGQPGDATCRLAVRRLGISAAQTLRTKLAGRCGVREPPAQPPCRRDEALSGPGFAQRFRPPAGLIG
jgi:hypothetical protein